MVPCVFHVDVCRDCDWIADRVQTADTYTDPAAPVIVDIISRRVPGAGRGPHTASPLAEFSSTLLREFDPRSPIGPRASIV